MVFFTLAQFLAQSRFAPSAFDHGVVVVAASVLVGATAQDVPVSSLDLAHDGRISVVAVTETGVLVPAAGPAGAAAVGAVGAADRAAYYDRG